MPRLTCASRSSTSPTPRSTSALTPPGEASVAVCAVIVRVPSTDGVELAVRDLGGRGTPMLLAHATGFHGAVWAPLFSHLADRYHGIAPDLRGHGDSSAPASGSFAWTGFADDVLAVIDALELDAPVGVGHSKGGAALLLAEERRPGTFEALYLYEPVVFPPDMDAQAPDTSNPLAESALRRRASFDSFDAAFENFAAKLPFAALDPAALRAYVDHGFAPGDDGRVHLKCRPENEAEVYRMGAVHKAFDELARVRCPVVVARGASPGFGPAEFAHAVVAALPDGRLEEFGELGHFGPLERPEVVAAAVARAFAPT